MWEPRALDLFRVVVLGCEPAVCAIVRNGFLGSIHSTVTTWSKAAERIFPSLLRVSRESHSSCSVLGDLLSFLGSVQKWGFFIFYFLFLSLSFVKYSILKWWLKHLCGKTSWLSFSVNILSNTEAVWKHLLVHKLIRNLAIFSYMKQDFIFLKSTLL